MLEGRGSYKTKTGLYTGEFHKSLEHGTGERVYLNGATYFGDWQQGVPHGKGKLKDHTRNFEYEGYFVNGLK